MNNLGSELDGKRVLFLTWPFYEYPEKIKNSMEQLGATVDMYYSAPTTKFLKVRLLEKLEFLKKRYFNTIIKCIEKRDYDYIFVVNPAVFPEFFLKKISIIYSNAIKISYSWDSIEVYPKAVLYHKYFDRIYSFDSEDVKRHPEMSFLPLFYCEDLCARNSNNNLKYVFSFIGFGHTERYKYISKIKEFAERNNYSYCFKLFLPSKLHFFRGKYLKHLFPDAKLDDFIYKPVSHTTIREVTEKTKIIIDIELRTQSGLTIRTIETLGMHKKLITTNEHIKEYDFYNSNNILVVDRDNPKIPNSFIQKEYVELPNYIYTKYSLSSWVKAIFRVENEDEN